MAPHSLQTQNKILEWRCWKLEKQTRTPTHITQAKQQFRIPTPRENFTCNLPSLRQQKE
jgi:hypothetical protein